MVRVLILEVKVLNSTKTASVPLQTPRRSKKSLVLSVIILSDFDIPFPGGDLEELHIDDNLVAEAACLHIHVLPCVIATDYWGGWTAGGCHC